jgi:hypothetical protein
MNKKNLVLIFIFIQLTNAQLPLWSQCGGNGYTGPNECDQNQNLTCFKKDKYYHVETMISNLINKIN